MLEAPKLTKSTVRLSLLGLGWPNAPTCRNSARACGILESWLLDLDSAGQEAWEVHALETAWTLYVAERAGDGFVSVDFDRLVKLVGSDSIARIAMLRSGLWPRKVGDAAKSEWSDKPTDRAARSIWLGMADVSHWDGTEFILRDLAAVE